MKRSERRWDKKMGGEESDEEKWEGRGERNQTKKNGMRKGCVWSVGEVWERLKREKKER